MVASATSWKHEPFKEGIPLPYQATFDSGQLARLKMGLIEGAMKTSGSSISRNRNCFCTAVGLGTGV